MAAERLCKLIFRNISFATQVLMDIVKGVFTLTFPSFFFRWVTHQQLFRLLLYVTNIFEPLLCDRHLLGTGESVVNKTDIMDFTAYWWK